MEATDQYDYLLKFIIIGNSGTGKSCLLHYFLEGKCKVNEQSIINLLCFKLNKIQLIQLELSSDLKFYQSEISL